MRYHLAFLVSLILFPSVLFAQERTDVPVAPGSGSGEMAPANYEISANDTVAISVFQEPDLSVSRVVASNGMITLPLIDQIKVSGMTARQAETAIARAYKDEQFLRFPQVTVTVTGFVARSVSVLGYVNRSGPVMIPQGQVQIDLLSAIAGAGGLKGIAQKKKVRITRADGSEAETVNVEDLMKGKGNVKKVVLNPGDRVYVPQRLF